MWMCVCACKYMRLFFQQQVNGKKKANGALNIQIYMHTHTCASSECHRNLYRELLSAVLVLRDEMKIKKKQRRNTVSTTTYARVVKHWMCSFQSSQSIVYSTHTLFATYQYRGFFCTVDSISQRSHCVRFESNLNSNKSHRI